MTTSTGIIGVRTNDRIEFNPQKYLLGKVDGFPLVSQSRLRDGGIRRRILIAI